MEIKEIIEQIVLENINKTYKELEEEYKNTPTGCLVTKKIRKRVLKQKDLIEKQEIANSFLDLKNYPLSIAEFYEDKYGKNIKIYYEGKKEILED